MWCSSPGWVETKRTTTYVCSYSWQLRTTTHNTQRLYLNPYNLITFFILVYLTLNLSDSVLLLGILATATKRHSGFACGCLAASFSEMHDITVDCLFSAFPGISTVHPSDADDQNWELQFCLLQFLAQKRSNPRATLSCVCQKHTSHQMLKHDNILVIHGDTQFHSGLSPSVSVSVRILH